MTLVLLNNVDHQHIRVRPAGVAGAGADTIQVLAFAPEFAELQRHYPILFRRNTDGIVRPVAILGLNRSENLFIDAGGRWQSGVYIPASIERGPFALAQDEDEDSLPRVLIDIDHLSISHDDGEQLFLARGGNARFLERMMAVLGTIFEGEKQADALVAALDAAGLLHPANLQVRTGEDEIYAISDVQIVQSDVLQNLSEEALLELHRAGYLTHAVHAATSLGNLQRLADLQAARRPAGQL